MRPLQWWHTLFLEKERQFSQSQLLQTLPQQQGSHEHLSASKVTSNIHVDRQLFASSLTSGTIGVCLQECCCYISCSIAPCFSSCSKAMAAQPWPLLAWTLHRLHRVWTSSQLLVSSSALQMIRLQWLQMLPSLSRQSSWPCPPQLERHHGCISMSNSISS